MKECKKGCPPEKLCNTETGRCVLRTGAIGKRILAASEVSRRTSTRQTNTRQTNTRQTNTRQTNTRQTSTNSRCRQVCPTDKICNPATGRCVLRTGAIGRRLLGGTSDVQITGQWVPLTYPEIKQQLPRRPVTDWRTAALRIRGLRNQFGHPLPDTAAEELHQLQVYRFGPHLMRLTKEMAQQLRGQMVHVVHGQNEYMYGRNPEVYIDRGTMGNVSADTRDPVYIKNTINPSGVMETTNYVEMTLNGPTEYVTAGMDPVYIFVKRAGESLRPAPPGL